ncbi:hypothetical protein CVD28_01060 [Bacillus sp. M6-12]|uniref:nucleotidyltransferase domain-containing protein n=1 Tax=Bacillus sp. M6-12 TaxID=2054166 RepID=UPI000C76F9C8|nr:nucleotidyltransferase domain-containing protein [Bacillus sp. M6-12]PLS19023.1 hypothetical protein CVD28_01060 [Bacillus sp. M6-12]
MELKICEEYQMQQDIVEQIYQDFVKLVPAERLQEFIKKEKIEKIMLYGSRAKGTRFDDSDIDMVIVSNTKQAEKLIRKLREVVGETCSLPMDISLYHFESQTIFHITFGKPELCNEELTVQPMPNDFQDSFCQSECIVFTEADIFYQLSLF